MDATEEQKDKMNAGATGRQKCAHCPRKSLPGLVKGQGRCAYHFAMSMWGKAWADHAACDVLGASPKIVPDPDHFCNDPECLECCGAEIAQ